MTLMHAMLLASALAVGLASPGRAQTADVWGVEMPNDVRFTGPVVALPDGGVGIRRSGSESPRALDASVVQVIERTSRPRREAPRSSAQLLTLASGSKLQGRLHSIDAEHVVFASRGFGELTLPRTSIESVKWNDDVEEIVWGDPLPSRWTDGLENGTWIEAREGIAIVTPGTCLEGNVGLDRPATVELLVGWDGAPDFEVEVPSADGVVRLRGGSNGVLASSSADPELPPVLYLDGLVDSGQCWLRLCVLPDRVQLLSPRDLTVFAELPRRGEPGSALLVRGLGAWTELREVTVTRTYVEPFDALTSEQVRSLESGIDLEFADGSAGSLLNYGRIDFAPPGEKARSGYAIECESGDSLLARAIAFEGGAISIDVEGWGAAPPIALDGFVRIESLRRKVLPLSQVAELHRGRTHEKGEIVGVDDDTGALLWSTVGLLGEEPLDSEGPRVQFRKSPRPWSTSRNHPYRLLFDDGDAVPCAIEQLDGEAIHVRVPGTDEVRPVARRGLVAILFDEHRFEALTADLGQKKKEPEAGDVDIFGRVQRPASFEALTKERLATVCAVPRSERAEPSLALIVGRNGDLLRTDIGSIDGDGVTIVRRSGATATLPSSRVAAIVFLEYDAPDTDASTAEVAVPEAPAEPGLAYNFVMDEWGSLRGRCVAFDGNDLLVDSKRFGRIELPLRKMHRLESDRRRPAFVCSGWRAEPLPDPR